MDEIPVGGVMADSIAALQEHHDVADFLVDLIDTCQRVLSVDATGIMLLSRGGRLQLLSASSHRSADLELHQSQIDEGPCVDAATADVTVIVAGDESLRDRWPRFGPAMVRAGFRSVHSAPLRWDGSTLGAMALFRHEPVAIDGPEDRAARAFGEVVVHAVMDEQRRVGTGIQERVEAALAGRMLVEQAKGVVAQMLGVDLGEAYDVLVSQAKLSGQTLTAAASGVIDRAVRG